MKDQLTLIDGSSYLYRAFHALPPLKTSQGEPSGAIYGVISMLKKAIQTIASDRIAVIFDSPTPTFRHTLYPDYKANRLMMPEELQAQISPLQAMIEAMGLPLIIMPGIEADDIIASLAQEAVLQGLSVVISTNDKDFAQIVSNDITLSNTMTGLQLDPSGVKTRFGIAPDQIVDYLSLIGDSSDNIPGIPFVGPKTAVKWLTQYGTLANIVAHAQEIKGKVGDYLRAHLDTLHLTQQLITLKQDIPLTIPVQTLKQKQGDPDTLCQWFQRFEFKNWLQELLTEQAKLQQATSIHDSLPHDLSTQALSSHDNLLDCLQTPVFNLNSRQVILTKAHFTEWLAWLFEAPLILIHTEIQDIDNFNTELTGLGFAMLPSGRTAYLPLTAHHDSGLSRSWVLVQLKPLLEDETKKKIGYDLKKSCHIFFHYGIELAGLYADTLLEAYLLHSQAQQDFDSLTQQYLNQKRNFPGELGQGKKQPLELSQTPLAQAATYVIQTAHLGLALHQRLEPKLSSISVLSLRDTLEMPLIKVLFRIEQRGVKIAADRLRQQSQELAIQLKDLEEQSWALAGQIFNLNSPQQLQTILYQLQGLPSLRKTATGQRSTSEEVLQILAQDHPLPGLILQYRRLNKLKSTYTDSLPRQIHPKTDRLHTMYHQAIVATGRLSSSHPNLQNIPIRTPAGQKIRQAFIATPGYLILSADYSQIELGIMAHLSGDANLIDAFRHQRDIHTATAAELFDVPLERVTPKLRRQAKTVNFGLLYGISAFGLAAQLKTTPEIAKNIISRYFNQYPGIKDYTERTRAQAQHQGYVTTLAGRRLYLPHIHSTNPAQRRASERVAINAPLQGTAADIIKRAMIDIDTYFSKYAIDAYMIMQVHDELVFEVHETALDTAKAHIISSMEEAAMLSIPISVNIGIGHNWDEAAH